MWICQNCETENEDNFKFCWGCGQNRAKVEAAPPPTVWPERVKKVVEVKEEPPVLTDDADEPLRPARTISRPQTQSRKTVDDDDVLPMLARVAGVEKNVPLADEDVSLERKVFTIAVRLLGLFMLYQVFVALPDLIVLVSSAVRENAEDISEMFTSQLIFPVARVLAYFIVGIYLIASGRILIRMLPQR